MGSVKKAARRMAVKPALALGHLGFTPNALTIIGSVLTGLVGVLAAQGWFLAAGLGLWLFSLSDTLDGALARATGRVSPFGAFLDSVCDRYAEAGVFLGLVWWFHTTGSGLGVMLAFLAAISSLMVSYARARAEGLNYHAEVGWFQRPERIVALGLGLVLAQWVPVTLLLALGLLAVLTTVTVVQRVWHVSALSQSVPAGPSSEPAASADPAA